MAALLECEYSGCKHSPGIKSKWCVYHKPMTAEPDPTQPDRKDTTTLREQLLHDMRMLSEEYFGNETYGKYLSFNHKLQELFERYSQEIAREARSNELHLFMEATAHRVKDETWEDWAWRVNDYLKPRVAQLTQQSDKLNKERVK